MFMALKRNLSSCSESDTECKKMNVQSTPSKITEEIGDKDTGVTSSQLLQERENALATVKQNAPEWFTEAFDYILKDLNYTRECTLDMTSYKASCEENTKKLKQLESRVNCLEKKNRTLEDHILRLEDYSRRNILIIKGIPEDGPAENCNTVVKNFLNSKLKVPTVDNIDISSVHRLGKPPHMQPSPVKKPRNMILRLANLSDRDLIWKHRFNLKSTPFILNEDFSPLTQERRKQLQPYFIAARKHPSVKRCQLIRDCLMINGQRYTIDEIDSLPFGLSSSNTSRAERRLTSIEGTAFFGSDSFLSNFHKSPIEEKQQTFSTVEHYYQYKKALYFNDQITANAILSSKTPNHAKALSYQIKDFDKDLWMSVAEQTMFNAVTKKFEQNPVLQKQLLSTSGLLIEANPTDTFFSCGLSLSDPNIEVSTSWKGLNILGKVLCKVRDNLAN